MKMTILEDWNSYKAILPKNAGPNQILETRRAFYAGAFALLCKLQQIAEDAISEDEGVVILATLQQELNAFKEGMYE